MKKYILLSLFSLILAFAINAQSNGPCDGCDDVVENVENNNTQEDETTFSILQKNKKNKISIYPNPAANFIGLSDTEDISQLIVFNVVGRKMASFNVFEGKKYDVSELPRGMYLIQVVSKQNKILTTQRLSKR